MPPTSWPVPLDGKTHLRPVPRRPATLRVAAFNVGMPQADGFKKSQSRKVQQLADFIETWFAMDIAVVGLNEIHEEISVQLKVCLEATHGDHVTVASHDTNTLVRCTP